MQQLPEIKIGQVLSLFMKNLDINDQALAKQTGIPLPTIARLRRGRDVNPTTSTLRPLAQFFNISVGQLIGDEPLEHIAATKSVKQQIPILKWEQIHSWLNQEKPLGELHDFIATEQVLNPKSFAIIMNATSQNILFQRGTLLIVDPALSPLDGDFILVNEAGATHPEIKQILMDGKDHYIKSINPEIAALRLLTADNQILGVIVEARHSFKV